jgi:hypothetical protein
MTQLQCIRLVQQEQVMARAEQLRQMREEGARSLATGESAASLELELKELELALGAEPAGVHLNKAHQKLFERQDMMKQLNFLKGIGVLTNRFTTEQLIKHL